MSYLHIGGPIYKCILIIGHQISNSMSSNLFQLTHTHVVIIGFSFVYMHQYIKILVVCPCVREGCGRGRNEFAGRVQNHHVRFSSHVQSERNELLA